MKRFLSAVVCLVLVAGFAGCGSSNSSPSPQGIVVSVANSFQIVGAGNGPITLTASVTGGSSNQGVQWSLSLANVNCSPACGTLKPAPAPGLTAVYTPPAAVPTNQTATITVTPLADVQKAFTFNFQIVPPISVSITTKFTTETAGGPVVNLAAQVNNDIGSAGVTWTLTAGGQSCSPACGTLMFNSTAQPPTEEYQPPAATPTGANASPTITATSVADSTKSDSFSFTIVAPPIAVAITNKFSTAAIGAPAVTVNAQVTFDTSNAGVTWTLLAAGAACSPACGTLVPAAAPSFSASYTAPTAAPSGAAASPTITATSVSDHTKADSFTFQIVGATAFLTGDFAFELRGFDSAGKPLAIAGSLVADGAGNVTGGEYDSNDNGTVTSVPPPLSGTYTVDTSFNGIPRVTITLAGPTNNLVLKCALSSDGKRGKIIEFDGSFALAAGTILLEDPAASTALSASTASTSFAFGLDSDAGTSGGAVGRIVEAGQFVLGAGATSVTGGFADANQSGAAAAIFGGAAGPASIAAGAATAPDALGRGTLTLSINGNANQYAYYVVNSRQLNLIELDAGGALMTVQAGTAEMQIALDASSINATSVFALTGSSSSSGTLSTATRIGVLSIASGSGPSATYDQSISGNTAGPVTRTGSIFGAFNPATGRYVLANTIFTGTIVYLYDVGKGFVIDATGNGSNTASSGPLLLQAAGPFSTAADLSGNFIGLAGGSSIPGLPNIDFAASFDGSANYSTEIDLTTADTGVGSNGQIQNYSFSDIFVIDSTTVGRGLIQFPGGVYEQFGQPDDLSVFYVVGPNQFVAIGAGPNGAGGYASGVVFFDPQ
jgi:hypothetical protein